MKRILITGNAGSGKTTLSKQIHSILGIPLYSLDSVVWKSNWRKTPTEERTQKIQQLISKDEWVIDGVSLEVQNAADCVVFLDCSRLTSYQRAFRRNLPYLFKSRPGLPDNCPEYRILPKLISIIWNFPSEVRPRILATMSQQNGQKNYHLNTKQDVCDFIGMIEELEPNMA